MVLSQRVEGGCEVILVDNGSTDGSVERLRARWPAVCVVETGENLGFARGNNAGISRARGRQVVFPSDTRVAPGWLAPLARPRSRTNRSAR